MARHEIEIPHALDPADVRERLGRATTKLEQEYKTSCAWQGDGILNVTRKGLDAKVHVEGKRLRIEVELSGLLMSAAWPAIRRGIVDKLRGLLEPTAR